MARVFLINPPTPEVVRSPLLGFCHLAAALRRRGHEVALLDCSAPFAPKDHAVVIERVAAFAPDLVGVHIKTLYCQQAYALAAALAPHFDLIAGGPHATVCPEEPLRFGFRYVLRGEGEWALSDLCDVLDGRRDRSLQQVPSLTLRSPLGIRHNPSGGFLTDLDALPSPLDAVDLFDPAWYDASGISRPAAPCGLLSSRGCPAACTFCCNNVTGRRFRYHSADRVVADVVRLRDDLDTGAFSFFDDSFAVGQRRMETLCQALKTRASGIAWTCTAHPAHLSRDVMTWMRDAGCGGIDLGMESGDPDMLLRIGKGVRVEQVLDVLTWARELGIHTVVNLMFGWPDETLAQLRSTIAFMAEAAPLAQSFNARGVLVPYPGTAIYDEHHARFGFTEWWLREPPIDYLPFPSSWSTSEIKRAYADDAALARNFFGHPPAALELIQQALTEKARHTFAGLAQTADYPMTVPAAGAR